MFLIEERRMNDTTWIEEERASYTKCCWFWRKEAPLKTVLLKSHQKKRVLASTKDKDLGWRQSFHTHSRLSQTLRKGDKHLVLLPEVTIQTNSLHRPLFTFFFFLSFLFVFAGAW